MLLSPSLHLNAGGSSTRRRVAALVLACALLVTGSAAAQGRGSPNLARATLEDLMNIEITSASRREQRVMDTAAAVHVITQEEIRRSGLTEVPELLRLAPGVQVARIDASKWAIAIRGFNTQWSDKLLVLIDGRTVYNRLFSGVFWDGVNLLVDDIDRIEVIRGPGASVWGANAVNGVINILTRRAQDTQGWLVRGQSSTLGDGEMAVRYGGQAAGADYRLYVQGFERGPSRTVDGGDSADDWRGLRGGARFDWQAGRDGFALQAEASRIETGWQSGVPTGLMPPGGGWPIRTLRNESRAGHVLARWTRLDVAGGTLEVQGFADFLRRDEPGMFDYRATTVDADATYTTTLGGVHDLVTGAGYRVTRDRIDGTFYIGMEPARATVETLNMFVQSESRFAGDRLRVTLGTKVEHDTLAEWGVQPTARVLWALTPRQRVWAAVSRAIRSPSRGETALRVNFTVDMTPTGLPLVVAAVGNPGYLPEEIHSVEAGYRIDVGPLFADVTAFHATHDHLRTYELRPPMLQMEPLPHVLQPLQLGNGLRAETSGLELSGRWAPLAWGHVDAAYTYLRVTPRPEPGTTDPLAPVYDGYAPSHQWQVRPGVTLGRLDADLSIFHAGRLNTLGIPAYTRADLNVAWRLATAWSVATYAQNLFAGDNAEFGGTDIITIPGRAGRRAGVTLSWRGR